MDEVRVEMQQDVAGNGGYVIDFREAYSGDGRVAYFIRRVSSEGPVNVPSLLIRGVENVEIHYLVLRRLVEVFGPLPDALPMTWRWRAGRLLGGDVRSAVLGLGWKIGPLPRETDL